MTEKEAIKLLEIHRSFTNSSNADVKAIDMAKAVLEKQIAKKPDYEGDGYADGKMVYDTWICPRCDKRYEIDYDEYDYCPNCGQHIARDWSEI